MAGGRDERVNDLYMEELVGDPTEAGQIRHRTNDIVAFVGGTVKSLTLGSGALPPATQVGQVLFSVSGSTFTVELPVTSAEGWLVNNEGILIVNG